MTPKSYKAKFIESGIISYNDQNAGVVLVSKEALDRMAPTFKGCPVIFVPEHHNSADKETSFNFEDVGANPPAGIVSGAPYWGDDGWQWIDMLVWDEDAVKNIERGFSVSCAYLVDETTDGGKWHELDYDEEIVNGHYLHMSIVPRPRYEGSQILANSKGDHKVDLFKKKNAAPPPVAPDPVKEKEPEKAEGKMMVNEDATVDVNGTPVPLHELMAAYMEKQGAGEPQDLADEDEVQLPDGTRVTIGDLKAAYSGGEETEGAEGESMENAEAPTDTKATLPVDPAKQVRANSAPARVVNKSLQNAASKTGDFGMDGMDTEAARLDRGKARYSLPVKNGGR